MLAFSGAIRMGMAPTSSDLLHRAPAKGLDPMMRWTCVVESAAVRRAGVIVGDIESEWFPGVREGD